MHKKLQVKIHSGINQLERGFTLIEILVTIAIIAVITSMSLILFNPPSDQRLRDESSKLRSLIQMASDEAVLQGREIGVEFMQRGYRFLDFDPFLEIWNKREDDHIFRERYSSGILNGHFFFILKALNIVFLLIPPSFQNIFRKVLKTLDLQVDPGMILRFGLDTAGEWQRGLGVRQRYLKPSRAKGISKR